MSTDSLRVRQVSAATVLLKASVAYDQHIFLVQRSEGGWGSSDSGFNLSMRLLNLHLMWFPQQMAGVQEG